MLKARGLDKTVLFCVTAQDGKASVAAYSIAHTGQQLSARVTAFQAAVSDPQRDYQERARALYDLLIAPAAKQLQGRKRLVICPDGPLWGLPFQALMTRGRRGIGNAVSPPETRGKLRLQCDGRAGGAAGGREPECKYKAGPAFRHAAGDG